MNRLKERNIIRFIETRERKQYRHLTQQMDRQERDNESQMTIEKKLQEVGR